MSLEFRDKVIGEHTYRTKQLGAVAARKLLMRLVKVLGPAFSAFLRNNASLDSKKLLDMKLDVIAQAVEEFSNIATDEDLEYVCAVFGAVSTVEFSDGRSIHLDKQGQDTHFSGRLFEMLKWLGFCLEANFSDFFVGMQNTANVNGPAYPL